MTDENLNADNSVDSQQVDSFSQNAGSPVEQQAPDMAPAKPQDGSVSQEKLTSILLTERKRAYEKGMQAANQRVNEPQTQQPIRANDQAESIDQRVDALLNQKLSDMQKNQQEAFKQQQYETFVDGLDKTFNKNIANAKEEIDGFDEKMKSVNNFDQFRGIKLAISQFGERGGQVLNYLADNPHKIGGLDVIAMLQDKKGNPNFTPILKEFKKISDSIALNDNAKKSPKAPSPISQINTNSRDGFGKTEIGIEDWKALLTT
ncbi:hypothetical protein [uncultured Paraglaciecola sp.]|uniref:hypothetical protein n=1 Tax=uncultured Paraglaciecola sp. TaxID=1765024 RepID=UPI002605DF88|nr:hypothetical protein [uncultured Paraglaciecola sp.]